MNKLLLFLFLISITSKLVLSQFQIYRHPNDLNDFSRPGLSQAAQFARTLGSAMGGYPVAPLYPAYDTYGSAYDPNLIGLSRVNSLGRFYAPKPQTYYLPPPLLEHPYGYRPRFDMYPSYGGYRSYNVAPSTYSYVDSGFETESEPGMLKGAFNGAIRGTLAGAFGI